MAFRGPAGTAICLALAVSLPLVAQRVRVYQDGNAWVQETTGSLPVARDLRVNTDVGSVEVRGRARGITYVIRKRAVVASKEEADREFQRLRISAASVGDQAVIEGKLLQGDVTRFTADFAMQVPFDLRKVLVTTNSGALKLTSLSAVVTARTGAGAVKLNDLAGPVSISTGGGDITGGSLGSEAVIKSGGGSVHIESVTGAAKVNTGGGNVSIGSAKTLWIDNGAGSVQVGRCFGDFQASTGGGNVQVGEVAGSVRVDAGAGSVRVAAAGGRTQVTTGGGNVELYKVSQGAKVDTPAGSITVQFTAAPGAFTDSSLHTGSGDVLVFLPEQLPVTVHASSDMAPGYGIRSDLPGIRISRPANTFGPRSMWAEGALNGGGPLLRVRTGMGHIDFRKTQ